MGCEKLEIAGSQVTNLTEALPELIEACSASIRFTLTATLYLTLQSRHCVPLCLHESCWSSHLESSIRSGIIKSCVRPILTVFVGITRWPVFFRDEVTENGSVLPSLWCNPRLLGSVQAEFPKRGYFDDRIWGFFVLSGFVHLSFRDLGLITKFFLASDVIFVSSFPTISWSKPLFVWKNRVDNILNPK